RLRFPVRAGPPATRSPAPLVQGGMIAVEFIPVSVRSPVGVPLMPSVARPAGLACGFVLAIALTARGAGPAETLFQLVPPDAAATLAIEDLRGHAREWFESPVAEGFRRLPAFRAWRASDHFQRFEQA